MGKSGRQLTSLEIKRFFYCLKSMRKETLNAIDRLRDRSKPQYFKAIAIGKLNGDLVVFKIGEEELQAVFVSHRGMSNVNINQVQLYHPDIIQHLNTQ